MTAAAANLANKAFMKENVAGKEPRNGIVNWVNDINGLKFSACKYRLSSFRLNLIPFCVTSLFSF